MLHLHLSSFLAECTVPDDEKDLSIVTLHGLYISWILMGNNVPASDSDFCAALQAFGLRYENDNGACTYPGLGMAGRPHVITSSTALPQHTTLIQLTNTGRASQRAKG